VVAVEVAAGDEGDGVLVEGVAVRVDRARDDVDALHAVAAAESDGSLDGDSVGCGELLQGEGGLVCGGDGVDAVEGGDVVHTKD
jgi:hypothetical protein